MQINDKIYLILKSCLINGFVNNELTFLVIKGWDNR